MRLVLFVLGLADIALCVLLAALSGFILHGVNNTGPIMPDAIFYLALLLWCFVAPLLAIILRNRIGGAARIALCSSPLAIFLFLLIIPL
jgi:hypothetical protein